MILDCLGKAPDACTVNECFLCLIPHLEQFCEISEHANLEPGEPDALAFATNTDAIEAVIPIACRQSTADPCGPAVEAAGDGAPAMFEKGSAEG